MQTFAVEDPEQRRRTVCGERPRYRWSQGGAIGEGKGPDETTLLDMLPFVSQVVIDYGMLGLAFDL